MKITITRDSGMVVVDGVGKPVDTSILPAGVEVVFWNSDRNLGFVQWDEDTLDEVDERDLEGEEVENIRRRANNLKILEEPMYRRALIRRQPVKITSFAPYQAYLDKWNAYVPPPPEERLPSPELVVILADAEATRQEVIGNVDPQPAAVIKAMTKAQARAWFDANFTNQVQLIRLVRWMFLYMVRRL